MNDKYFSLHPVKPDCESLITLVTQRTDGMACSFTIEEVRRINPNLKVTILEVQEGINYQCTPLDAFSQIQVKLTYHVGDKRISITLTTLPIALTEELREKMIYEFHPIKTKVICAGFSSFVELGIDERKIVFSTDNFSKFSLQICEDTFTADQNQKVLRMSLTRQNRNSLPTFFTQNNVNQQFCLIVFSCKDERDQFSALIAASLKSHNNNSSTTKGIQIVQTSTTLSSNRQLMNNHSTHSFAMKREKGKIKISERLNLKRSFTKRDIRTNKQREIMEEKDKKDLYYSLDLSESIQALQNSSFVGNIDCNSIQKSQNQRNFTKKEKRFLNQTVEENKVLRQQNDRMREEIRTVRKAKGEIEKMKRKYTAIIQDNNRLEQERRAIIKEKVIFESSYHRERMEKERLKKDVEELRRIYQQANIDRRKSLSRETRL